MTQMLTVKQLLALLQSLKNSLLELGDNSGITAPIALLHLRHHDACGMTELSRVTSSSTASSTGIVDRLVRLGLVRRVNSAHDRRAVYAMLSDKGMAFVDSMMDKMILHSKDDHGHS